VPRYLTAAVPEPELGYDLNSDNLCRWRSGGYQDWLREESWLEEMRARLDFATDIVQEKNGALLQKASLRIAVVQMYKLLTEFDARVLKEKMANDPRSYSRLLSCLCKLTDSSLRMERAREARACSETLRRPIAFAPSERNPLDPHLPQKPAAPRDEGAAEPGDASAEPGDASAEPGPESESQPAPSGFGKGMLLAAQALMAPDIDEPLVAEAQSESGPVNPPVTQTSAVQAAANSETPSHPNSSRQIAVGNEKVNKSSQAPRLCAKHIPHTLM
jgi:hypothetical protein